MANFIAVIDSDVDRRVEFVSKIKPLLSPVEGLTTGKFALEDFCCVWSALAGGPQSHVSDEKGGAAIWGDAIIRGDSVRVDSEGLRSYWNNAGRRSKGFFDGFYAGVVYDVDKGFVAGADVLGMFPVYYWSCSDVLLVGSSPELFRYHRSFRVEFNPAGFLGIALTSHIFDGQTMLKGVRRLSAGHLLFWERHKEVQEVFQYRIGVSEKYFSLPFSGHIDILDHALDKTIGRHVTADNAYSLMLSGGLDSRMLAGYLDKNGVCAEALTMGMPKDLEMRCAIPVAKMLCLNHHAMDVPFEVYSHCACLQAKWEHLCNGFNNIPNWGLPSLVSGFSPYVILGHTLDAVVGTRYINWAYSRSFNTMSFETFFSHLNAWAIRPVVLKRLLRREVFGDLVDQTVGRIREVYESYSDLESQRAWCFNLYHRQRFHVAGAAWAMSFGSWPVVISLDRELLETAGGMPASTIAERRAEKQLLCDRFPRLASLSLDRNSYDTRPLQPRLRYELSRYLYNHLRPSHYFPGFAKNGKSERRYYARIYDFNNSGWRSVRHKAESYRSRLFHIFNKEVLDELLPGPSDLVSSAEMITDSSSLKLFLGLMLWSENYSF